MGVLENIAAFTNPKGEAAQGRTQALHGVLGNIGDMLSQFLSPRGREFANNVVQSVDTVSPIAESRRLGQEFNEGNYGDVAAGVAAYAIPAGILARYGPQTSLAAAQFIAENLSLFGGSMKEVGESAYEAVLQRMNQPGPVPTLGSNLGNLGKSPTNTKSKTILMPDGTRIPRPKTMADVPDIRNMPVEDALFIARQEPHIIAGGKGSRGAFIGGPENIKSRRSLTNQRAFMDSEVDAGAPGGDWYDRFRDDISRVTSNQRDADWMANQEGQYSAGVSPEGEVGYSIKDTNSAIALGTPNKPARPAQQAASARAIETNDPANFQLGEKTGEYARRINPRSASERTATGVNDFRHARTLGYTEPDGRPQREGLHGPQHKYSDYETALMVERANQRQLEGRTNWTGEQIQAAPWVKQKADDFYERQKKGYLKKARDRLAKQNSNMAPGAEEAMARQIALEEAGRTIGDYFPKHTAFATYEAQPFVDAGHLPGLAKASQEERIAFASDPLSTWANAKGGRDEIYANTRLGDTGYAMRVQPTTEMQGVYTPPAGVTEYNPGEVARPLVGFDTSGTNKTIPAPDRSLMDAGEATRAYVDAQGAGAWHTAWKKGQADKTRSISAELPNERPLTQSELGALGKISAKYNLPDIVDTGQGATITSFYPEPGKMPSKQFKNLQNDLDALGIFESVERVSIDSGYLAFEDAWKAGVGSGEATKNLLSVMDGVPSGTYDAFNNNVSIGQNALDRMSRDERLAGQYGGTRKDIQNARKIIGEGKGWIDRLRAGLEKGLILPGIAAGVLSLSMREGGRDEQS